VKYRPDIDGLRAVAIVPVVLFHAGVAGFGGGYVGVDVFFVVSGYLITGLVAAEIREGRFSLVAFYERRVRRIFPALFTVLCAASIAAVLWLVPADLQAFGRSLAATALFASNLLFWRESGYFDAQAETRPLLHTWSLAVEEQFYIVFPLLLLLAWRVLRERWVAVPAAIVAVSFVASAMMVASAPVDVFYLAHYRAWELLLGALAALGVFPALQRRGANALLAVAGLGLIAFAVFGYSRATPFPGAAALAPGLGTLAVILAGSRDDAPLVSRWLAAKPVVFVGLISYPLYLWHWPLLVFASRIAQGEPDGVVTAALVAASVVLATLTWRFIEQPIRRRGPGALMRGTLFAGAAACVATATAFGLFAATRPHAVARQGDFVAPHIRGREDYGDRNCFLGQDQGYAQWQRAGPCVFARGAGKRVLVWGDSFAAHYLPGLAQHPAPGVDIVQYTAYSCPPVLGARVAWAPRCGDINDHLDDVLDRYAIDTVVVAARWERYAGPTVAPAAIERTLAYLHLRGLRVVLVGQGPSFDFTDPAEYRFRTGRQSARTRPATSINARLRQLQGVDAFLDPTTTLCRDDVCPLLRDGQYLYWDAGHYSTRGSVLVADDLLAAIEAAGR
jgi:peptidoglycan/LPS O-acetylase OafA/YrhL